MTTTQLYCPNCTLTPDKHQDDLCGYRYYFDSVNELYGWIQNELQDLMPVATEKTIQTYGEDPKWDEVKDAGERAA